MVIECHAVSGVEAEECGMWDVIWGKVGDSMFGEEDAVLID